MPAQVITISGARQHNLKNLHVEIPREKLVVITGLSGSGKSSLAFDPLYAEGQRRYVESLSAYARQFLDQMEKPNVDFIQGLSPAIAIEQRSAGANPKSKVTPSATAKPNPKTRQSAGSTSRAGLSGGLIMLTTNGPDHHANNPPMAAASSASHALCTSTN